MYRHVFKGLAMLAVISGISFGVGNDHRPAYTAVERFTLHQASNGVDGTLELLLDRRLTESARKELWGKGDWSFVLPHVSPLYKEFTVLPPGKSKLVIRSNNGLLVAERQLDTPLARLEAWNAPSGANQLFILTEDYTAGVGSYNGPGAILLQISEAAIQDVKAVNAESQKDEPIRLVKSLKSDWRREGADEILSVSCRARDGGTFVIDYVRYAFNGRQWLEYKRQTDGFWESDEPFPNRSAFP